MTFFSGKEAIPTQAAPPVLFPLQNPHYAARIPMRPPPPTNLLFPETPTPARTSSTCSSTASVTPAPNPSSAAVLEEDRSVLKSTISTVYARRRSTETQGRRNPTTNKCKGKGKGKEPIAAAGTASCPPLGRATRKTSRKDSMTRPISSSAPCHGAKKKRPSPSTPKLPEDFVKKQRAYFSEIDAFELPVEEVSESELE